jgi:hypothetical protein
MDSSSYDHLVTNLNTEFINIKDDHQVASYIDFVSVG